MINIDLDMDMPNECNECRFQLRFKDGEQDDWYCRRCVIENRVIEYPKPKWCPLRSARISMTSQELKQYNALCRFVDDLEHGRTEAPGSCCGCPAHNIEFGIINTDLCLLNIDTYVGDMFFASRRKTPSWCPAKKYEKKEII